MTTTQANMGLLQSSARLLNAFHAVWNVQGLIPEEMDFQKSYSPDQAQAQTEPASHYPLRPELIESTYHQYR